MSEDSLTKGGKLTTEKSQYVTYGLVILIIVIAGIIYWQFSQTTTDTMVVDTTLVNTIADLPPTVASEPPVIPAETVKDPGLAEVPTTVPPRWELRKLRVTT